MSNYPAAKWFVCFEAEDTLTNFAVQEIVLAASVDGADISVAKTVTGSLAVTNPASAFDGDDTTAAAATGDCVFTIEYATPQAVKEIRVKYPASVVSGSSGPVRIAVAIEHPVTLRRVLIRTVVGVVPSAGLVVRLPINTRVEQQREFRLRAQAAMRTAQDSALPGPVSQNVSLDGVGGVLNVKDFGATGDGVTDDTAAIKAAIAPLTGSTPNSLYGPFTVGNTPDPTTNWRMNKVIYFPPGTYVISDTLLRFIDDAVAGYIRAYNAAAIPDYGRIINGLIIRGAGVDRTKIVLKEGATGFQTVGTRKPMVLFGSSYPKSSLAAILNTDQTKKAGTTDQDVYNAARNGSHDLLRGEGVDAYDNVLMDITLDTGNNPGADGVWGLFSNGRGVETVRIVAPHTNGVGLDLTSDSDGPSYHENIEVRGFAHGILAQNTNYNTTFENVWLNGQGTACITNTDHVLALNNVAMRPAAGGVGLANNGSGALVVLRGDSSVLDMSESSASAITNTGYLNLNTRVKGVSSILGLPAQFGAVFDGVFDPANSRLGDAAIGLPEGEEAPVWRVAQNDPGIGYLTGVDLTGVTPINTALNALLADTTKHTIVFPCGKLAMNATVTIPDHIRCLDCNFAYISQNWTNFVTANNTAPLIIKNLYHNTNNTTQDSITHNGSQPLVVRNAVGTYWINRAVAAGKLFLTNLGQSRFKAYGTAPVFLRQFNTEGSGTRCMVYNGADVWALSTKTEQNCTAIEQTGGTLQLLCHYAHPSATPTLPAVKITDARLYFVGADAAHTAGQVYTNFVEQVDNGATTNIEASTFVTRSLGHLCPKYTVDLR